VFADIVRGGPGRKPGRDPLCVEMPMAKFIRSS
jgi:hypothetical protein